MNSFDGFTLTGANATRYLPIFGNASGIIGAYRKYAEPHKKYEPTPLSIGQIPLFLLDGELPAALLKRAKETLHLTAYVAIYRPFDISLKKKYEALNKRCRAIGFIKKDGTAQQWLLDDMARLETIPDEIRADFLIGREPYPEYLRVKEEYEAVIAAPMINADTGDAITGDLNEYLFRRAREMYPLGIESILEANTKQSAISKLQYFTDGMEGAAAPKGVRECGANGIQLTLFEAEQPSINDAIVSLRGYIWKRLHRQGAVELAAIISRCAEAGLYKGNITLYAIGAALRDFNTGNAVFYDSVCYWRYTEVKDISTWIMREYESVERRRPHREREAAIFLDKTMLKQRIEGIFGIDPTQDKRLDTLGMALVMAGQWIRENLKYPIAFLDNTLHKLLIDTGLYGDKLQRYSDYFTAERCGQLRAELPYTDTIARRAIMEAVGYDPETMTHGMSNLPKGHYAPVLYSAEDYIAEMKRKPVVA